MHDLIIASHNQGKITEIADLLAEFSYQIHSTASLNIPEPEETASDFAGNAALKAEFSSNFASMPALADDSGLCIDALDGAPGIYSARFAKQYGGFAESMDYLQQILQDNPNKGAHFTCALALAIPGQATQVFEGHVYGTLSFPARGDYGFGYDPIFMPQGYSLNFAEMKQADKHRISHRAVAFEQLKTYLHDNG